MTTKKRPIKIRVGDTCPDCKKGKLLMTLTCEDDTCGCNIHPADGYQIERRITLECTLCDLILRHAHLLTCYNCGAKLSDKVCRGDDRVGVLHIDPGSSNYPREPDEPAVACFECMECAQKDKNLLIKVLKSKELSKIQVDLLSSFLAGHWKEIAKSEHRVAFERILETLDPGVLRAIKHLAKEG